MKILEIYVFLFLFSFTAFSQAIVKINSFSSLKPNSIISIPVEVSGIPNVCALDLEIIFDKSVLNYIGISKVHKDKFDKDMVKYYNCLDGKFRYNWFSADPEILDHTTLFYLDVEYIGGTTDVVFASENCRFTNADFQKYLVTYQNGLLSGSASSVDDNINNSVNFNLAQNFPNPFNPSTKISFSLPEAAKTRLTIYNITGSEIAELVNSYLNAGQHQYIFNATDLPSGVYLYKITSGRFFSAKKMFLIK